MFYDPLKQGPDLFGGLNELLKMYMQLMMMKRYFGGQQPTETLGQTPIQQGQDPNAMWRLLQMFPGQEQQTPFRR